MSALPSISQYVDSLTNPSGLFRTLGEVDADRDARGAVRFCAGSNAAVFRITAAGEEYALKCPLKRGPHFGAIYEYIETHPDPLFAPTRLLRDELYVYDAFGRGGYCDVVVSQWLPGVTLETEIKRAARECPERFGELAAGFDAMASALLGKEWAHGDLKPENIIVGRCGAMSPTMPKPWP